MGWGIYPYGRRCNYIGIGIYCTEVCPGQRRTAGIGRIRWTSGEHPKRDSRTVSGLRYRPSFWSFLDLNSMFGYACRIRSSGPVLRFQNLHWNSRNFPTSNRATRNPSYTLRQYSKWPEFSNYRNFEISRLFRIIGILSIMRIFELSE